MQVGSLQAELALVQAQLANSRYAVANAYQNSETLPPPHPPQQQPLQQQQHYLRIPVLQPAYSNTSPATSTTNFINIEGLACANFDMNPVEAAASSHTHTLEPLHQFSHPSIQDDNEPEEEEEDEEEESQIRALFGEETLGRSRR